MSQINDNNIPETTKDKGTNRNQKKPKFLS